MNNKFFEALKVMPPPWHAEYGQKDGGYLGVWASNNYDVVCRVSPINKQTAIDIPDAILLSAAPELLEALILETIDHDKCGLQDDRVTKIMVKAIEKATRKTWVEVKRIWDETSK